MGKSTFCKILAKKFDLEHIEIESNIAKLFQKIKDFQDSPELDEDGNPKEYLSETEKAIVADLTSGNAISNKNLLQLLNIQLSNAKTSLKGYVLDLPLYETKEFCWADEILDGRLKIPRIGHKYFSHVIEFINDDEEVFFHTSKLSEFVKEDADSGQLVYNLYSNYDIELMKKPKLDEDGNVEEVKVPEDHELLKRSNEGVSALEFRI